MLARMSSSDLAEYMAYDAIEPFGESRADLRAGIVAAAVANHSMSPPKTPARPVDFMPYLQRNDEPILLADPNQHGDLIAKTLFGKVK